MQKKYLKLLLFFLTLFMGSSGKYDTKKFKRFIQSHQEFQINLRVFNGVFYYISRISAGEVK